MINDINDKKERYLHYFFRWISMWVGLFSEIVGIITLGFHRPNWDMNFLSWTVIRECRIRIRQKENQQLSELVAERLKEPYDPIPYDMDD